MDYFFNQFGEGASMGIALISHFLLALPLWKMATRTKDEPKWFAWVPILNALLILKVAKKPYWWLILLFVPFVNFIILVVIFMALCERFGVNKWWGLLGFFSPANLVLLYYLAYATDSVATATPAPAMPDAQPAPATAPPQATPSETPAPAETPPTEAAPEEKPPESIRAGR